MRRGDERATHTTRPPAAATVFSGSRRLRRGGWLWLAAAVAAIVADGIAAGIDSGRGVAAGRFSECGIHRGCTRGRTDLGGDLRPHRPTSHPDRRAPWLCHQPAVAAANIHERFVGAVRPARIDRVFCCGGRTCRARSCRSVHATGATGASLRMARCRISARLPVRAGAERVGDRDRDRTVAARRERCSGDPCRPCSRRDSRCLDDARSGADTASPHRATRRRRCYNTSRRPHWRDAAVAPESDRQFRRLGFRTRHRASGSTASRIDDAGHLADVFRMQRRDAVG